MILGQAERRKIRLYIARTPEYKTVAEPYSTRHRPNASWCLGRPGQTQAHTHSTHVTHVTHTSYTHQRRYVTYIVHNPKRRVAHIAHRPKEACRRLRVCTVVLRTPTPTHPIPLRASAHTMHTCATQYHMYTHSTSSCSPTINTHATLATHASQLRYQAKVCCRYN